MSETSEKSESINGAPLAGKDVGRVGRGEGVYDLIHQWVMLSGVSAPAVALYQAYRMHVNDRRGDSQAWPGIVPLAHLLGVPADRISALNKELVAIDAIRIHQEGMPRHNVYTINSLPPDDYTGPTTLAEWYTRNGERLQADRDARSAKVANSRAKAKDLVSPVTGKSGLLGEEPPVTRKSGLQVTRKSGLHVTRKSGLELNEVELDEVNNPPTPRDRLPETPAPVEAEPGGGKIPPGKTTDKDPLWGDAQTVLRRVTAPIAERQPERMPVNGQRAKLMELTVGALRSGWSVAALVGELGAKDLRAADSVGGVLRARLERLPAPPAPPTTGDRCRKHRGQPAATCAACEGEAKGAEVDDIPPGPLTRADGTPLTREELRAALQERIAAGKTTIAKRERKGLVRSGATT